MQRLFVADCLRLLAIGPGQHFIDVEQKEANLVRRSSDDSGLYNLKLF
jgi:hypothetical protein